ncbi:orotidine 5'-phosphate decarboxylase / HUMPS family protein [Mollicutes bacterium LVI A0039]|nr:orotidine 5'-phosphate decarboxylase / HUMPS family protein [Mollicutes bacterium LVI A0039]
MIPKLQVAMDNVTVESMLEQVYPIGEIVDVIEIGTVLHLTQGMLPLKIIRQMYGNDKMILSDLKCADAGTTLCQQSVDAGANQVTAICAADLETIALMKTVADQSGAQIHIELYGEYSSEMMEGWKSIGIEHVIYHRSRDSQLSGRAWGEVDFNKIKILNDHGFKVTITGGLEVEDIKLFKDFNVYCFIAGRSIRESADSVNEALRFKAEIKEHFHE